MSDVPPEIDYTELCSPEPQLLSGNSASEPIIASAVQKLLQQPEVKFLIVESLWSSLGPKIESSVRKVLKEELEEKLKSAGIWDGASSSVPRKLALEFLGKVCPKIYTGEAIKAEGGDNIRVALKDADGNIVKSGTEASSEVELMVLLATGSSGNEPRMPHVSPNRLKLNEGIAVLVNTQLKRPVDQNTGRSVWANSCSLKLVVSSVGYIKDATVESAETGSFLFGDRRGALYNKHRPPQLSDEVWRLLMISRNRELHKLLEKENINSVEQFLIAHTKDPESLQKMLKISDSKLKTIVDHAMTCPDIPKSLHVYHSASWKTHDAVVFDVVGCVRGLLYEGQGFVPADNLPEDVKVDARKEIVSAFKHWEDVQPYIVLRGIHISSSITRHWRFCRFFGVSMD